MTQQADRERRVIRESRGGLSLKWGNRETDCKQSRFNRSAGTYHITCAISIALGFLYQVHRVKRAGIRVHVLLPHAFGVGLIDVVIGLQSVGFSDADNNDINCYDHGVRFSLAPE